MEKRKTRKPRNIGQNGQKEGEKQDEQQEIQGKDERESVRHA